MTISKNSKHPPPHPTPPAADHEMKGQDMQGREERPLTSGGGWGSLL